MSMNCWKTLGSPPLSRSPTMLKYFDSCTYTPYGILSNLHIELGGKTVTVEVELVDRPLDYNILLGIPWVYAITVVVSTYFRMIAFRHKGGITIIDQLAFFVFSSQETRSILLVHGPPLSLQNIGGGLFKYSSLMGKFSLPSPSQTMEVAKVETCNMISSTSSDSWNISNNFEVDMRNETMPLSPFELA